MDRRLRSLIVLAALPLLAGCWSASQVQPAGGAANFPDPGLLQANGRYYRYATNANGKWVPVHSSTSLTGPWTIHADAFPNPPSWVLGHVWGPEVHRVGDYYYLYYSATIAWDGSPFGEHAIGVARSSSPTGPFTPVGPQPLYRDPLRRGAIDPDTVFFGTQQYLIWSTDWGPGGRASGITRYIRGGTMASPTSTPTNGATLLASGGAAWEHGTVEAPSLIGGGDGNWHLFYSGGNFESSYGIGHAICGTHPLSACTRTKTDGPWAGSGWNGTVNPGGADLIPVYWGVYAGMFHSGTPASGRQPWSGYLSWVEN